MNKKLLIFAIGVVAYIIWKKMNESKDETSEIPNTKTPSKDTIVDGQKYKLGATRQGANTMTAETSKKYKLGAN